MDGSDVRREQAQENMAKFVNQMLKSLKSSYKSREEQLSQACQACRARLEGVLRQHEKLLCAYRDARSQLQESRDGGATEGEGLTDLGPEEAELVMSDSDLQSSQQKEIVRLQTELHRQQQLMNRASDSLQVSATRTLSVLLHVYKCLYKCDICSMLHR